MFHEVTWFLFLTTLWMLALTVGLPITLLLMLSTTIRRKLFSWILVIIASRIYRRRNFTWREKAFDLLKSKLEKRDKNVPLEVLEIGVGEGINFRFYPENCNLTVLDPNKFFESYLRSNLKKFSNINFKKAIACYGEKMEGVADNSFDVVVSSYVHCYVDSSEKVLKEVKRVLKPGGKYVFMEHVKFPSGSIGLCLQRYIKPLWILYSAGCHLDRDTGTQIKKVGFKEVICENVELESWWMYMAKHTISGVATK